MIFLKMKHIVGEDEDDNLPRMLVQMLWLK